MVRDEKLPYPGIRVPRGASRTVRAANGNVTLGSLPLALFLHGHGYFVQRARIQGGIPLLVGGAPPLEMRLGGGPPQGGRAAASLPAPYAVHATYTLDNHDGLAKAQRFREGGLWRADPPSYYEGLYLAINGSISPELSAALEAHASRRESPANIAVHLLAVRSHMAELRDALALATALGRTLVLPRWACYCDRLWSGSDDIFHFGCMYPGAQDGKFVPFVCPMDHVLSPSAWHKAGVAHRDAGFVDGLLAHRAADQSALSLDAPGGRAQPLVRDIRVGVKAADGTGPDDGFDLPLGLSDAQAKARLSAYASVPVLRLSHSRGLLCGLEGSGAATAFNQLAAQILSPPPWCSTCFQRCDAELAKWLDADTIARGARGQGPNRWCAPMSVPPEAFAVAEKSCPAPAP